MRRVRAGVGEIPHEREDDDTDAGVLTFTTSTGGPDGAIDISADNGLAASLGSPNEFTAVNSANVNASSSITTDVINTQTDSTLSRIGNDPGFAGSNAPFDEIWAYDYYDAASGQFQDGGSTLPGLTHGTYPDHATPDDDRDGVAINKLSTYLYDVVCDLNDERERLQERVDDLEARLERLEDARNA